MKPFVSRGLLVGMLMGAAFLVAAPLAFAETNVSGDIPDGTTWTAADSPYVVNGARILAGSTLTIEPGVVVKFLDGRGLTVEGTLLAVGTETEEIYFTSIHDDSVGGDTNGNGAATTPDPSEWQQVRVFENGVATIRHAVFQYGGLREPVTGTRNCSPTLRHCQGALTNIGTLELSDSKFFHNYGYDIYQTNGTSIVDRTTFSHATNVGPSIFVGGGEMAMRDSTVEGGRRGIEVGQGVTRVTLTGNTFIENALSAVTISANVDFLHSDNVAESGEGRGFRILGEIASNRTWYKDTMPYLLGGVEILEGATLTIEPGTIVKALPDTGMAVYGSLIAEGGEEDKISFVSIKDDSVGGDTNGDGDASSPQPGDWTQLRIFNTGNASISHAVLKHGGYPYRPGTNNCGAGIQRCQGVISIVGTLTLADSEVSRNTNHGIYQTGGTAAIERSLVKDHTTASAILVQGGTMTIKDSSLAPNNYNAVDVSGVSQPVDARDNWWGDPTGPLNTISNPGGFGVGVSENVLFDPWLGADPFAPIHPLILQYEPILYFHEDEDFYPMNVEAFIASSALWDDRGVLGDEQLIPAGEVTTSNIVDPNSENWYLAFSDPDNSKSFDPTIASTAYKDLVDSGKAVPTYYAHKMDQGDWTVLQYWYFYAFNSWAEHGGFNNHEGDWESVFIFLDKDTEEPEYVAFSAHHNDGDPNILLGQYGSVRRGWNDEEIITEGDRAVSFVAAGSHANYSNESEDGGHDVPVLLLKFKDKTSSLGTQFRASDWADRMLISETGPVWMRYEGRWGADRTDFLDGESGPRGPYYNNVSGTLRFQDPVGWAGVDKISTKIGDSSTSNIVFENQTTQMYFSEPVPVGETVTSDQHDELITFGNLDEVNFLPRFWDFSTTMENESFNVAVSLAYDEEEIAAFGLEEEKLSVFLYDPITNSWDAVETTTDPVANTVSFETTHFSRYAIGQGVVTNEPPVLDPIGDRTIGEGDVLTFTVTASDPDEGDTLTFSAHNLPEGASFDPLTQIFYWDTDFDDAGNYTDIEFAVTDDGDPVELDVELITITVGNTNRAPVFENPGPQEVLETERLEFVVLASDPDGDGVTLLASSTPEGATFSTTTGEFSWRPTRSQEGTYVATFVAIDDGEPQATATLEVVITVGDNPTPVEQAHALIDLALSYQLPKEIENSYLANLKKVPTFIEEGKITPAIQQLEAFRQKVEMDYRKGKIGSEIRHTLLEQAGDLYVSLEVG